MRTAAAVRYCCTVPGMLFKTPAKKYQSVSYSPLRLLACRCAGTYQYVILVRTYMFICLSCLFTIFLRAMAKNGSSRSFLGQKRVGRIMKAANNQFGLT